MTYLCRSSRSYNHTAPEVLHALPATGLSLSRGMKARRIRSKAGFVESAGQLYIARFALGLAEAGYFPSIVLSLGYWFQRRGEAKALALILMGIQVASILGAPVSGLILDLVHWFGVSS